jgi:hypothetical protein
MVVRFFAFSALSMSSVRENTLSGLMKARIALADEREQSFPQLEEIGVVFRSPGAKSLLPMR